MGLLGEYSWRRRLQRLGLLGVTRPAGAGDVSWTGGEVPTSRSSAVDSGEAIAHLGGELRKKCTISA